MSTPHKHAAVIKAWADGAEVQSKTTINGAIWHTVTQPNWYEHQEYRVRPAPLVLNETLYYYGALGMGVASLPGAPKAKVRFTLDPDTKEVLAVELIKE